MPDEISDTDYIVRYCRPRTVENNRVKSTAFEIRSNEDHISVNWMPKEIDTDVGLERIKSALAQKNFEVRAGGRFVIFNVGVIRSYVYELRGIKISICHKPSLEDPTHAGISLTDVNMPYDKQKLMYSVARAFLKFTKKHPHIVHPIFDDKRGM